MNFVESLRARWIEWVWDHTPTCAEMARLSSQGLERPPTWKTRLRMRLHWLICVWCERYYKQLKFLHQAAPRLPEKLQTASNQGLSAEAKERMIQRLHNQ